MPENRLNGGQPSVSQIIVAAEEQLDKLRSSGNLLDRIIYQQQYPGIPFIPGPIVKIQQPGGPPPGAQSNLSVMFILHCLASGQSEEKMLSDVGWLTHDDIRACKLWWRNIHAVCMSFDSGLDQSPHE